MPVTDPVALVALLVAVVGLVFGASRLRPFRRFFDALPPVLWCYFLPMLLSAAGVVPKSSPVYDALSSVGLLVALFLLTVTIDVRAILRVGPKALAMLGAGALGIVIGGPVAFALFRGLLPADAWMSLAALSGTWIGGTANMVAIQNGIGAPDSAIAPVIVVDTVFAYGWMGVLLFFSSRQAMLDRWLHADRSSLDAFADRALADQALAVEEVRRPVSTADLALVVGVGLVAAALARAVASGLPPVGAVISVGTWAILVVVTLGLVLSFTPARRMEAAGAQPVGYYVLYVILATIGARADVTAIAAYPAFLLVGAVWMLIHIAVILAAARLLRVPSALVAAGSMATVGGPASTPVVAGTYHAALAPVGLLLAIASNIVGLYAGFACAAILRWMAT